MSNIFKSQTSFEGGEISPRLTARSDSPRYQTGLRTCENFIVTPQGSLRMREGAQYIGDAVSDEYVRLIEFKRVGGENFAVEIGAPDGANKGRVRLWSRDGLEPTTADRNYISLNGQFTEGADGLEYYLSKQATDGFKHLTVKAPAPETGFGFCRILTLKLQLNDNGRLHTEAAEAQITQEITVPASGKITLEWSAKQPVTGGQRTVKGRYSSSTFSKAKSKSTVTVDEGAKRLKYTVKVGTRSYGDDIVSQDYINEDLINPSVGVGYQTLPITGLTPGEKIWISVASTNDEVPVYPDENLDPDEADNSQWVSGVDVYNFRAFDSDLIIPPGDFESEHDWSVEDIEGLQYAFETSSNRMILVSKNVPPTEIYINDDSSWAIGPISINQPPDDWGPGNYPRTVEVFQSRVWYASTIGFPNRIWSSRSGSFDNFEPENPLTDASPIDVEAANNGVIQWLSGQSGTLLIGTDIGEFYARSFTGALTPTSIQIDPASRHGSAYIQCEGIAEEVMFITTDRRKLRAISYTDSVQNWTSADLTFPAEHITFSKVRRIENAKNPDYQIVMLMDDGKWVQCTYNRGTNTLAWHKHKMGDANLTGRATEDVLTIGQQFTDFNPVSSIASVDTGNGSALWFAVNRKNGIKIEYIESNETYKINMDSWVTRTRNDGFTTVGDDVVVTGLEHLENETVAVVVDGAAERYHLVENGEIIIRNAGSLNFDTVTVGLPMEATAELLPVETGNPNQSIQSFLQRRTNITVRVVDSIFPRINGVLPPERGGASVMDLKEPNTTEDVEYLSLEWERGRSIKITQDQPFRTEIVGIFGKTESNKV